MVNPVVVGIDGSELAVRAARLAAGEARSRGLPLRLVYASLLLVRDGSLTEDGYRRYTAERQRMLDDVAAGLRELAPDVEVSTALLPEEPVAALLGEAENAALLVVGSRGRGGFDALLLGSVALQVASYSTAPVLVVPAAAASADVPGAGPGEIVVGVDERHPADRALAWAFGTAELRGAGLTALHAVGGEFGAPGQDVGEDMRLAEALAGWTGRHPDVQVTRTVAERSAAKALVEASEAAALLVMGRRRRPRLPGLALGRVGHAVLHHARCPVVVVPEE